MSREWKPGDVAVTQFGRSVVASGKSCGHYDSAPHWHHVTNGGWDPLDSHPNARPLVVIDPEDREAVERLRESLERMSFSPWACGAATCLATALREFANPKPPKPDEPQGLGAVVEDEDGVLWFRMAVENQTWPGEVWQEQYGDADRWSKWDSVAAVRVLSPGVEVDQ